MVEGMRRFRSKTEVVEACQMNHEGALYDALHAEAPRLRYNVGDWIVRNAFGLFPMSDQIFRESYEPED